MASPSIRIKPLLASTIAIGGQPVLVISGPIAGGFIVNPITAVDQTISPVENLYVSITSTPATLIADDETFMLSPGGIFNIPPSDDPSYSVTVNAQTTGHAFSGVFYAQLPNFQPSTGTFPPTVPTTVTQTIPSYLYQQYNDDEDLQAFVDAYNQLAQEYVTWFVDASLPIYPLLSGSLLDWIAEGLYGITRPALSSGVSTGIGPYNTWAFNTIPYNSLEVVPISPVFYTTDDIFKRIITWHFYKGDGKIFDIRWLKRRVMRFLTGVDGTAGQTGETYPVSITFGPNGIVNINLQSRRVIPIGGAVYNTFAYNSTSYNDLRTITIQLPVNPLAPVFKQAMDSGALEFPFQYTAVVNVD